MVEDEPDIREGLADFLAGEGYSVAVARDGLEGLERARTFHPDLIVLDLMMPVMDGYKFLEARRTVEVLASVPVIIQTARQPADVPGCAILYKPFDLDALVEAARRSLESASTGAPAR